MPTAGMVSLLGTMRFVSRHEETQLYGAIVPKSMTNQAMLDFVAYKTYYKAPVKADIGKSLDVLSEVALSEAAQLKKVTKQSKKDFHISHESGSSDGTDFQSGVPDEQQRKISVTDEGTGAKPGVFNVPKYDSNSDKESWGDSGEEDDDEDDIEDDKGNDGDDDNNGDDNDDNDCNDDDDDDDNGNDDDDDSDHERTESDRDENPYLNQFNEEHDDEEEENVDEFTDKEDDEENEEELDDGEELYKDVNVNLRKEDVEITNADQGGADQHNVSQESGFEQEEEDAHVTLTTIHDIQKTEGPMQSSFVSSDFTEKLLNFENISPANNEIASLMDTTVHHEEPSGQTSTPFTIPITIILTTIPQPPYFFNPLPQQTTPTPIPTASEVTTAFPLVLYFASVFRFNDRSSSQPKSAYEAAASLSEYELTKILLDKIEESKSHLRADYKRELYDALVKSYNTDKDLFETYDEVFMLKRSRDEKDKDQDPSAGSDRGTKRRKSSKEAKSQKDPSHTVDDSEVKKNQEFNTGNNDEQPEYEDAPKNDWFKKPERPPTPDPDWNKRQHIDFQPPQTWISVTARAKKPPTLFDELMDTPIDFSAFVMNQLNITNMTQELLVGPAFNLLKGTCKSLTELEYHFKECSKATTERLDWHDPEGKLHPFDLRKPLPLIPDHRGRQVIPHDYFINNDQEYLKVTRHKIIKKYDYSHLDEIEVRREEQQLYIFKEGDFPRLRLQDIEDMLLLLVQQKLTNLTIDERYDLNVALRMFTRRIVIQSQVEDLQLGVESYQKKLNLTKPDIFRSNHKNRTAYTTYLDPQGVIYNDQNNRNKLLHTNELHKFSDGTLNDVQTTLHDITSRIRMEYLPKRKWSGLDKRRAHVMIQDIDKQLFQIRLMRNLEKFFGGREYEEDLRLLTQTI
ncbi:hypothetical protein Tco_0987521 [Tanacetum coccineum]